MLNLKKLFKKKQDNKSRNHDKQLIYPYVSQSTLKANPYKDECNLARMESIRYYLNNQFHPQSNHLALKPYFSGNKSVTWLAIVAGINIPPDSSQPPSILLEKVIVFDATNPKFLDYHLWLKVDNIKYVQNTSQSQIIAIGDAIIGISNINYYHGPHHIVKYGFNKTIIKGAGIFTSDQQNKQKVNYFKSKLITDYNRHNDWILKLKNNPKFSKFNPETVSLNLLLTIHGAVKFSCQNTKYPRIHTREFLYQRHKQKHKKRLLTNLQVKLSHTVKAIFTPQGQIKRYRGQISKVGYFVDQTSTYHMFISLNNIIEESTNNSIPKKSYFIYEGEITKLNQLLPNDIIEFSTNAILPTNIKTPGKITNAKFIKSTKLNRNLARQKVPEDFSARLGFLMWQKNDHAPEHLEYREAYNDWAMKNEGSNPFKEIQESKDINYLNLISDKEIYTQLCISKQFFKKLIDTYHIKPVLYKDRVTFFDKSIAMDLQRKLIAKHHLNQKAIEKKLKASANIQAKDGDFNKVIVQTRSGRYISNDFSKNTNKEIKDTITMLKETNANLFIKVKDKRKIETFISINNIISVKAANTSQHISIK